MVEYSDESGANNDAMTEESGNVLRENNEKIVRLMSLLRKQRDEMNFLIDKQETEKGRIQNEIEKLSFKLTLLTKSLSQRVHARTNYDKTINEIEGKYHSLVNESGKLLMHISKDYKELEEIMDKKTGTGASLQEKKVKEIPSPTKIEKSQPHLEEIPSEQKISSPSPNSSTKEVPGAEGYDLVDNEYPFEILEEQEMQLDVPSKPESEQNSRRSSNTTEVTVTKVAKKINEDRRMSSNSKTEERKQGTANQERGENKSGNRRAIKSAEEQAQDKDKHKNWKSISDSESMSRSHEGSMSRNRSASQNQESDDSDDEAESQGSAKERRRTLDSFNKAKSHKVDDEEVQSFREAYGRQHTHPQVPSRSPSGFRKTERKRSTD